MTSALNTSGPMISADAATKRYVKYEDSPMLVGTIMRLRSRSRRSRLWAVKGVTFDIDPGQTVGIIGRNGSGKTTLLQMLAGVTAPTTGSVTVRGRVAPLISVGVGFHPELTGRENVYVSGMVLGLSKPEIDARLDEIIAFSELEAFVDTPVKFYSSGMFVRLGFAAAVTADPDVLLVDEVLAVGDFAFQQKCFARIEEIRKSGATIILVSHSMHHIRMQCDRTMVMHQGELHYDGATDGGITLYQSLLGEARDRNEALLTGQNVVDVSCAVERLEVIGESGEPTRVVNTGEHIAFEFDVVWHRDVDSPMLGVLMLNEQGVLIHGAHSLGQQTGSFRGGERSTFRFEAPARFGSGTYRFQVMIRDSEGRTQLLPVAKSVEFLVSGRSNAVGIVDLDGKFVAVNGATRSAPQPATASPNNPQDASRSGRSPQ